MRFDIRGRATGKTHDLIAAIGPNPDAALLVPSRDYAERLKHIYPDVRCHIVAWSDRERLRGLRICAIRIDNIDIIIERELASLSHYCTDTIVATSSQG